MEHPISTFRTVDPLIVAQHCSEASSPAMNPCSGEVQFFIVSIARAGARYTSALSAQARPVIDRVDRHIDFSLPQSG